jgi:hypothetical protein
MNLQRAASTPRVGEVVAPKGAAHLCLERGVDGQLWAQLGEKRCAVWVSRCFPWSEPGRFISLRDEEEDEFALVRNPQQLDEGSRVALESSLVEAGFVLEIIGVEACEEEVEIRTWVVRTKQGRRSFQTRRDEWPRDVPGGGLLINDVSGDLFYVRDPAGLDPASRALLWAFVD